MKGTTYRKGVRVALLLSLGLSILAGCIPEPPGFWAPLSAIDAPEPRAYHTSVWTGSAMIVWGGMPSNPMLGPFNTGGVYDPASDRWTPTTTSGAPWGRAGHTAVWSGDRMLVWGGGNEEGDFQAGWRQGGMYDPVGDEWTLMTITGVPVGRTEHIAVWTGDRMVVWGGANEYPPGFVDTGGIYEPTVDQWTGTSTHECPTGRWSHTGVWTGSELAVWGGYDETSSIWGDAETGGLYAPDLDRWRSISTVGVPTGRRDHTAVWTGSEMIVWGGISGDLILETGAKYTPQTDTWLPIAADDAPSGRLRHTAVWTGSAMIVWGGESGSGPLGDGAIYIPNRDRWIPLPTESAPSPRSRHRAVWTGSAMIVWGGADQEGPLASGAIYYPNVSF